MKCPACHTQEADCIDSREGEDTAQHWRRRRYKCPCGARFTTAEFVVSVGNGRGYNQVVRQWLAKIRAEGAAEWAAMFTALLTPGATRARPRTTEEDQHSLQPIQITEGPAEHSPASSRNAALHRDLAEPHRSGPGSDVDGLAARSP